MPASLKEELEALAKQNRRSLTAEIVARLEESVASERDPVTTFRGIDKNALIATVGESTYSEQAILEAVQRALRAVAPDNSKPEPNSGPKPRKR